jgi:hypothetical protein
MGASHFASLLAGLLAGLAAISLDNGRDINVLPLFTFLLALTLWLLTRPRFFLAGLALGLAAVTRYEAYLLAPLLIIGNIKNHRALLLLALGFLIPVSPWWARNLYVTGTLHSTVYMVELTASQFHLLAVVADLGKNFGPVILAAAVVGLARMERRWQLYLAGFALLYLGLHVYWWYYYNRFLVPLLPILLPAGAVGIDRGMEWTRDRFGSQPPRVRLLWAATAAGPVLLVTTLYFMATGISPHDPLREAAASLRKEDPAAVLMGSNALALSYYSAHPALAWDRLPAAADPHRFVLSEYLGRQVRFIVWLNRDPVAWERFNFLAPGRSYETITESPGGRQYKLLYIFRGEFVRGERRVLVFELEAVAP